MVFSIVCQDLTGEKRLEPLFGKAGEMYGDADGAWTYYGTPSLDKRYPFYTWATAEEAEKHIKMTRKMFKGKVRYIVVPVTESPVIL
jgi:hypothetical protein